MLAQEYFYSVQQFSSSLFVHVQKVLYEPLDLGYLWFDPKLSARIVAQPGNWRERRYPSRLFVRTISTIPLVHSEKEGCMAKPKIAHTA
jgi:hypothetical protein